MFSNKLKRPALALAVTAGLLAVAGPASAGTTNEPKGGPPTNATASIIVYDFEGEAVHQVPQGIGIDVGVVEELGIREQPTQVDAPQGIGTDVGVVEEDRLGIREQPTQVNAPQGISIDNPVEEFDDLVVEPNTMGGDDSVAVWAPGDGSDF